MEPSEIVKRRDAWRKANADYRKAREETPMDQMKLIASLEAMMQAERDYDEVYDK